MCLGYRSKIDVQMYLNSDYEKQIRVTDILWWWNSQFAYWSVGIAYDDMIPTYPPPPLKKDLL